MSTIRIPLNSRKYPGLYALIDEADYELVGQYRWHPKVAESGNIYAATTDRTKGQKITIRMHRLIAGADSSEFVDHANMDGLDNRRDNLRIATRSENNANRPGRYKDGALTSRYRGVYRETDTRRNTPRSFWKAKCCAKNRVVLHAYFPTEIEAALAYDEAARQHQGKFARLNFPREGEAGVIGEIK